VQPIYLEKSQPKTGVIWQGVDKSIAMRQQLDEINGRVPFDELEKYHCATYNTLIKTVSPLRMAFRQENKLNARQEIATEEYNAWKGYFTQKKVDLEDNTDFQVEPQTYSLL